MLKEVFLIEEGILQYHYNSNQAASDSDDAVLSSGLLTAIRDFSQHARSDVLESFSTEHEYFLFTACPNSRRILVGVFSRKAPMQVARDSLQRISKVLGEANLPEGTGEMPSREKKMKIREQIDRISTQLFGREALGKYIEDLLAGRSDIPLAFLIDSYDKSLLAHFARPKPLFNERQVQDFLLLHSTIKSSLPKMGMDAEFISFVIESSGYTVSACSGGRLLSVASGAMRTPAENVESVSFQMCFDNESDQPSYQKKDAKIVSKAVLLDDGSEKHIEGSPLPPPSRIFVSTLVNNVDAFFSSINRRKFTIFEVRSGIDDTKALILTRTDSGIQVEIIQF